MSFEEEAEKIKEARGESYGDFATNICALTHTIEAMLMQVTQTRIKLPDSFGARVMVQAKLLRQCYRHQADNLLDAYNYTMIADKLDREQYDEEEKT